ncbi:hypothetical protein [Pseudogemmobacter sp. W21_MBD1_M6]|uniref:hypothetical protein n=1 Tax=Pseudogemmobacter sp. W21_MBD1_M6 TaxID=3240271 RepID=UPI003F9BE698
MTQESEPMTPTDADPKGLIRESYNIEGITAAECRSIFLDWALSVPVDADPKERILFLLGHYGVAQPDHPMGQVMREGLEAPLSRGRRGGRAARVPRDV